MTERDHTIATNRARTAWALAEARRLYGAPRQLRALPPHEAIERPDRTVPHPSNVEPRPDVETYEEWRERCGRRNPWVTVHPHPPAGAKHS